MSENAPEKHQQSPRDLPPGLPAIIHRLSQPLTTLRGALELGLSTEGSARDYRLAMEEALAQADHLTWLLTSLRELEDAQDPGDPTEAVSLGEVLERVKEPMDVLAESRGVILTVDSRSDLWVRADASCLHRGFHRIIQHAMERTAKGGRVRVSLSWSKGQACLAVSDDGSRAQAEELLCLTNPATLGDLFAEASKRGLLELAIAKRMFEALGNTVHMESVARGGFCFRVSFPQAFLRTS